MAVNKVAYGNTTLIDLSTDTVASASDIISGKIGHLRDGTVVTGNLSFITYYTGTGTPSSSLGQDGDIYLKTA